MRTWKFIKDGSINEPELLAPLKWRGKFREPLEEAKLSHDIFDGSLLYADIDQVFAVMASCGNRPFVIETEHLSSAKKYLADVKRRGKIAGPLYEKQMRAHFKKYKQEFVAGYTLPEPSTPELRAIYDTAGKRLNNGHSDDFIGGQYHWREWPLTNVSIRKV